MEEATLKIERELLNQNERTSLLICDNDSLTRPSNVEKTTSAALNTSLARTGSQYSFVSELSAETNSSHGSDSNTERNQLLADV